MNRSPFSTAIAPKGTVCLYTLSILAPTQSRAKPEKQVGMEAASKIAEAMSRVANSNAAINVALAAAFVVLTARSASQQRDIEALEAEKSSLLASNKHIKKTLWSWKQDLLADAESHSDSAPVPLARLRAIYGDAAPNGDAPKEAANSPSSKFVV